jgi:hypothetical protein
VIHTIKYLLSPKPGKKPGKILQSIQANLDQNFRILAFNFPIPSIYLMIFL